MLCHAAVSQLKLEELRELSAFGAMPVGYCALRGMNGHNVPEAVV
jgi:hypothetical protein